MRLASYTLLLLATSFAAQVKQDSRVRLVATANGWSLATVAKLQPLADKTARIIDELVPGPSQDYPSDGIICFEAPLTWVADGNAPAPITYANGLVKDDPPEAHGGVVRIALGDGSAVSPEEFVFQLSHELAHVKMGHRVDNYLEETFATAVSFEVLTRFGYSAYIPIATKSYLENLPVETLEALANGKWKVTRRYWSQRARMEPPKDLRAIATERGFQMVGAHLILHDRHVRWQELIGASVSNPCTASTSADGFSVCLPDLSRMRAQRSLLKPLGLKPK